MTDEKREKIKQTRAETRLRRQSQSIRSYELKIVKNHLSRKTKQHLKMLFVEAKWLYNYILSEGKIFDFDTKLKRVQVLRADGLEDETLSHLSSQLRQSVVQRMKSSVAALSKLKKLNYKIGGLRFKTDYVCLELPQPGISYRILDKKYIQIQGLKAKLRVSGLRQLTPAAELCAVLMIKGADDYEIGVVAAVTEQLTAQASIGIDLGCTNQLTFSNGVAVSYAVKDSRTSLLQRRASKKAKGSKNRLKARVKLRKAQLHLSNKKKDIQNKIVHYLRENYGTVCYQNDSIQFFQRGHGKKIQQTALGRIKCILQSRILTPLAVDQFYPSSQLCSNCGGRRKLSLYDRVYECSLCGLKTDRDLNAAQNILAEGFKIPVEHRDFKPVENEFATEMLRYFKEIPGISARLVQ